jgi:hypothetical protein
MGGLEAGRGLCKNVVRMLNTTRTLEPESVIGLLIASATLLTAACSGGDHLTEPLVSVGGAHYYSSGTTAAAGSSANGPGGSTAGGNTSVTGGGTNGMGGTATGGNSSTGTNSTMPSFDWGGTSYDATGGINVDHQTGHYPGAICFASCHLHTITLGGSAYQSDGTSAAANAQIGLRANGTLTTFYAGSAGNFFATISGTIDWTTAQIALRTEKGALSMPINANASGNCNNCHGTSNRIVVP